MDKHSQRRLLDQFSPSTRQRSTILANKVSCRNGVQLIAGRLHLQSEFSETNFIWKTLDASSRTEDGTSERVFQHRKPVQREEQGNPTDNPELSSARKLKRSTQSLVETAWIKSRPQHRRNCTRCNLGRWRTNGKIQEVVKKERNGSRTKPMFEDLGNPENSVKFSEESSRIIHEQDNIELYEIWAIHAWSPYRRDWPSVLVGFPSTWWSNKKNWFKARF